MEIKVIITAEPALMALLENLGKVLLIAGQDVREAVDVKLDGQTVGQLVTRIVPETPPAPIDPANPAPSTLMASVTTPTTQQKPAGIDFAAHLNPVVPVAAPITPVVAPVVPTAPTHTYTLSELGVAGADLAQTGKRSELVELLRTFGVQALTQLAPERYPEFAQGLRALGAKI